MIKTSQLGTSFVNSRVYSGNIKDLYSGGIHFKSLLHILRILCDFPQSIQSNVRTVPASGSLKFIIHLSANNELCIMSDTDIIIN